MKPGYTKEQVFEEGKTIEVYNDADRLVELQDYDTAGNLTMKVVYQYDGQGHNTSRLVSDSAGKQARLLEFEYNGDGKLVKSMEFDANNQLVYLKIFEYGRSDKKIKIRIFDKNNVLIEERLEDFV